ncbi:MAG: DeoR/GlpR family DNA-binding transcription regulator [Longicatena sp.]
MFTKERHAQIIEMLQDGGKVKVKELSELFQVSEDCIRKDLKQLESKNLCKRVYGGAMVDSDLLLTRNIFERKDQDKDVKKEIAQKAYALIRDGETIFLDVSTTNIYLAQLLARGEKHCIVISNMIDILQILAKNPLLTVIGTGGNVNLELNGFVGALTKHILEQHTFDRCFIGTLGVDKSFQYLTTFDLDDGLIKECVIKNSLHNYVVMDSHKFTQAGNYKFIKLEAIDFIITDSKMSEEVRKNLHKKQIKYM